MKYNPSQVELLRRLLAESGWRFPIRLLKEDLALFPEISSTEHLYLHCDGEIANIEYYKYDRSSIQLY